MRCPHAKRATKVIVDRDGNIFCPDCNPGPRPDKRLYTGKKIWAGSEAYTPSQLEQKNHDFIENAAARAAENRRRSPMWSVDEKTGKRVRM